MQRAHYPHVAFHNATPPDLTLATQLNVLYLLHMVACLTSRSTVSLITLSRLGEGQNR